MFYFLKTAIKLVMKKPYISTSVIGRPSSDFIYTCSVHIMREAIRDLQYGTWPICVLLQNNKTLYMRSADGSAFFL